MAKNFVNAIVDPALNGADMSASVTGTPVRIETLDNIGIQMSWTGATPGGAITIQVSLDYNPSTHNPGTWTNVQNSSGDDISISPGGSPGNAYVDLNQMSAPYIRTVYTTADGSVGSLTVKTGGKSV